MKKARTKKYIFRSCKTQDERESNKKEAIKQFVYSYKVNFHPRSEPEKE